ncbi:glutathione peroxidase [Luteibaculum oceani]|uniref:Glutathione peroxidase n=1 Tax=Luteibaculum oceani TaxID=1294296 RepID=A0A5C6UQH1_9FLAO|nr:glutathione peroxidase [Luteibaculum oceani]TXC75593.1 glutathione peroxidase [Luteibaculum oceani]
MSVVAAIAKSIIPNTILPRVEAPVSFYDLQFLDINGDLRSMQEFKGKHLLIVNTASKCGFTYQYEGLQELYKTYKEDLEIIGFPCNQFKKQEPAGNDQIAEFCELQFGVKFPMASKIDVKGDNVHPVYNWLTKKEQNGILSSEVEWNFQKYWIDDIGALRAVVYTNVKPNGKKFLKLAEELINEK